MRYLGRQYDNHALFGTSLLVTDYSSDKHETVDRTHVLYVRSEYAESWIFLCHSRIFQGLIPSLFIWRARGLYESSSQMKDGLFAVICGPSLSLFARLAHTRRHFISTILRAGDVRERANVSCLYLLGKSSLLTHMLYHYGVMQVLGRCKLYWTLIMLTADQSLPRVFH